MKTNYYDTGYIKNPMAEENSFHERPANIKNPLPFAEARPKLPDPLWEGHESAIDCYWKAWELAFGNIRMPQDGSGFVAPFIATAFNDCLFLWDSVFALFFGVYGRRAHDFQSTLDNLYAKQHRDGFMCREIGEADGLDRFHKQDPSSTGTHIMPWSEWEHYELSDDRARLARVFPVLTGFHRWLMAWRTWPDGSYWTSGWGAGMDNQPRFVADIPVDFYHGHMSWVDVCLQMVFAGRTLIRMAEELGRAGEVDDIRAEVERLTAYVNDRMWDEKTAYYYDRNADGSLSSLKTIGAYWALLAGVVPAERMERFVAHLDNPAEFNRPHRVPSMAADTPGYRPEGGYWRGGIWVFTNYPVMRGLTANGYDRLAYEIGRNHLDNVVGVYEKTGTIWETYAPESVSQGDPAKPDFVGAGGLTPVTVLFEYVFGLRRRGGRLLWDVRLTERHGVRRYPVGLTQTADLICEARANEQAKPVIRATSDGPLEIELVWDDGKQREIIRI